MLKQSLSFNDQSLLEKYSFQENPIDTAIAYGSGVMGHGDGMLDFIFSVHNPVEWHVQNIRQNGFGDYSCCVKALDFLDENASIVHPDVDKIESSHRVREHFKKHQETGAGIYYMHGHFEGRKMKVGVISKDRLLKDLETWNDFYVAGRLQKPQVLLQQSQDFEKAQRQNLISSIRVALLYLPEEFSWNELLYTVASLSYKGETRPEDPKKIQKIVEQNPEQYKNWLSKALEIFKQENSLEILKDTIIQEKSSKSVLQHVNSLPSNLMQFSENIHIVLEGICVVSEMPKSEMSIIQDFVEKRIRKIVREKSKEQTIKGIYSSGFSAIPYAARKVGKAIEGVLLTQGEAFTRDILDI